MSGSTLVSDPTLVQPFRPDTRVDTQSCSPLSVGIVYLLPSGSEQHEVLPVVGILIGILLYRLQISRSFFCWLKTCHYKKKQYTLVWYKQGNKSLAGFPYVACLYALVVSIESVKVVGYQRKYANVLREAR